MRWSRIARPLGVSYQASYRSAYLSKTLLAFCVDVSLSALDKVSFLLLVLFPADFAPGVAALHDSSLKYDHLVRPPRPFGKLIQGTAYHSLRQLFDADATGV